MKGTTSLEEKIFKIVSYTVIAIFALLCLYPFWHALMASISDETELMKHSGFLLKPAGFSLEAYKIVFQNPNIWSGFRNSLFLLCVGIPLDVILTAIGAYVFSRKNVLFKKPLLLFCMFTMYFSAGTIPAYLNLKDLHLTGTLWGVILCGMVGVYQMIVLKTSFEAIPDSLSEAARIDGAGHWTILFKIILPLSKASIAVVALQYGVGLWNGWFWASTIISDKKKLPLQVILRNMIITGDVDSGSQLLTVETVQYAIIIVAIVPILLVYPKLQKYFAKGVMIGSVKE